MRRFRLFVTVLATSLAGLGGCAVTTPPTAEPDIDQQILESSQKIQAAQAQLYQAGVMAQTPIDYAGPGTQQLVTLDWHGDALQLLAKLAHDHRLSFVFTGVRLPLPVTLSVQNATIDNVIGQIRAQISYRARLEERGTDLLLHYNPPR